MRNVCLCKLQSSSGVGKVAFFTSYFSSSPLPWPNVEQNVNVCGRNCSVISQHWIGGGGAQGIFSKRENSPFGGLKWTTVKLYNLPNYFCLWLWVCFVEFVVIIIIWRLSSVTSTSSSFRLCSKLLEGVQKLAALLSHIMFLCLNKSLSQLVNFYIIWPQHDPVVWGAFRQWSLLGLL